MQYLFCWFVYLIFAFSLYLSTSFALVSFANRISECVVNRQTKAIYRYAHTAHTQTDIEFKPQADQAHLQLHAQLIKMVTLLNENRQIE